MGQDLMENLSSKTERDADQYDKEKSSEYARMVENDPSKKYSQYPEALRLLGELENKNVLDIGCGSGGFTRMMAEKGAKVVGYDPAEEQVRKAQDAERNNPLGIKYFVSDRPSISSDIKFDLASSVLVLPHAETKEKLEEIFKYAQESLLPDGRFVSITLNPDFKRLGENTYNRRFTRKDGRNYADFLDNQGNVLLSLNSKYHSRADYEEAAKNAGFKRIEWITLAVDPKGKEDLGEEYWDKYEEDCPWIGLIAYKE